MAWNGSAGTDTIKRSKTISDRCNPKRAWLGICAIVGIGIASIISAIIYFSPLEEQPEERSEISIPSRTEQPPIQKQINETETTNHVVKLETYRDDRGVQRYKGGLRVDDPTIPSRVICNGVDSNGNKLYRSSVFTHNRAENEIERILTIPAGSAMIGSRTYNSRFEEDFKRSLETPIIIKKDDDERTARIKQAVIDAKNEICDRMRMGEKLGDILEGARSEIQRLAKFRRDINKLVLENTSDSSLSEQDVDDVVSAANKMLEREGIAPLKGSVFVRRSILLQSNPAKASEELAN